MYLNRKKLKIRKPRIKQGANIIALKRHKTMTPLPWLEFDGFIKNTLSNLATALSPDANIEEDKKNTKRLKENVRILKKQRRKLEN